MPQAWKYARVIYSPAVADTVAAKMAGWAAMGGLGPERGPGVTQDEAVQLVTNLSVLRHSAAMGVNAGRFAVYGLSGDFRGVQLNPKAETLDAEYQTAVPIVGDEPPPPAGLSSPYDPNLDPVANWPRKLVLAIDRVCTQIAKSEKGGSIPQGYGFDPLPPGVGGEGTLAAWPAIGIVAVIVGGAAIATIGGVAVWRYLDADVRTRTAEISAAGTAYQARLQVYQASGTMPPPGPLETANAKAIEEAAKESSDKYWLIGAAALAGIGGGAALISYLQREA